MSDQGKRSYAYKHDSSEYSDIEDSLADSENLDTAAEAVQKVLSLAENDLPHHGNNGVLGHYIRPGHTVLLKPNLVKEQHPRDPRGWKYVLTHGTFIKAVADQVFRALDGNGKVIVADAPQSDSSFNKVCEVLELFRLKDYYQSKGLNFELIDLRKYEWKITSGVVTDRQELQGDPSGYVAFDLAESSEFLGHSGEGQYYGADYDSGEVNRHHTGGRHEYLISGSPIKCDVFINLPKLKTHKKTGITVNLKNLVGINGDKNWLPHHTNGFPVTGGDQFPVFTIKRAMEIYGGRLLRSLSLKIPSLGTSIMKRARRYGMQSFGDTESVVRSGNWHGNDTTWRMCLDLNKLLLYGNKDGSLREKLPSKRKPYLCFVDGLTAGQGSGPMNPDPYSAGVVLFGDNPGDVDAFATVLMGFNPEKIPLVRQAFQVKDYTITDIPSWKEVTCRSNIPEWEGTLAEVYRLGKVMRFEPHFGWKGHIERG
jgi:uncharacterized protein (DUF362 family)